MGLARSTLEVVFLSFNVSFALSLSLSHCLSLSATAPHPQEERTKEQRLLVVFRCRSVSSKSYRFLRYFPCKMPIIPTQLLWTLKIICAKYLENSRWSLNVTRFSFKWMLRASNSIVGHSGKQQDLHSLCERKGNMPRNRSILLNITLNIFS